MKGLYIRNMLYFVDRFDFIKIIRYYNLIMFFLLDICSICVFKNKVKCIIGFFFIMFFFFVYLKYLRVLWI